MAKTYTEAKVKELVSKSYIEGYNEGKQHMASLFIAQLNHEIDTIHDANSNSVTSPLQFIKNQSAQLCMVILQDDVRLLLKED